MSDSPRAVFERFLEAYNRGDWDRLDELVTPDYVHNNGAATMTLEQFKQGAAWIRDALPDFRIEAEDMIGEGDRLAVRFVGRGTHSDSPVELHGIMIYRLHDGLIAEDWEAMDEQPLREQLGS